MCDYILKESEDRMTGFEEGKKMLCGGYSQYTPTGANYFKLKGRWNKTPKVGDIQYNYIASQGRIAHVAAVIECSVDHANRTFTVKTIEGNTSAKTWERNGGMVAEKEYVNIPFSSVKEYGSESCIAGFGTPIYDSSTCGVNDFIKVLKGEVGYIEKASRSQLGDIYNTATEAEKIANKGTNNYTKYGEWYGMNGVAWCQQFISWCSFVACKNYQEYNNTNHWENVNGLWFYYKDGNMVKGQWLRIDGRWYVFNEAGAMITGWFRDGKNNVWYYLNDIDGAMLANQWVKHADEWYYLTDSGVMATSCYIWDPDKQMYCYVEANGQWDGKYVNKESLGPGYEVCK